MIIAVAILGVLLGYRVARTVDVVRTLVAARREARRRAEAIRSDSEWRRQTITTLRYYAALERINGRAP